MDKHTIESQQELVCTLLNGAILVTLTHL